MKITVTSDDGTTEASVEIPWSGSPSGILADLLRSHAVAQVEQEIRAITERTAETPADGFKFEVGQRVLIGERLADIVSRQKTKTGRPIYRIRWYSSDQISLFNWVEDEMQSMEQP